MIGLGDILGNIVVTYLTIWAIQWLMVWRETETREAMRKQMEGASYVALALALNLLWQAWRGE